MNNIPAKLNLGSGKLFYSDYLNLDRNPFWKPDILIDFNQELPDNAVFRTERFGELALQHNTFEKILANDVLEHIVNLATAMKNCLNLLAVGGEMHIGVPYDLFYGAWQDPTHVRAFNEKSWLYYTDWFWYLGWRHARFDLVTLQFTPSELGQKLLEEGETLQDILLKPRCVDAMRVVLRKRLLTAKEKKKALNYQQGRGMRDATE